MAEHSRVYQGCSRECAKEETAACLRSSVVCSVTRVAGSQSKDTLRLELPKQLSSHMWWRLWGSVKTWRFLISSLTIFSCRQGLLWSTSPYLNHGFKVCSRLWVSCLSLGSVLPTVEPGTRPWWNILGRGFQEAENPGGWAKTRRKKNNQCVARG